MSVVEDAVASRCRIADPKPAYCVACWQGAQESVRFVDFDAAFEGGQLIKRSEDGTVIERISGDDLHLCESCVRAAAEAIGFKPEFHATQARQMRHLEFERDHWKAYAQRLEATLGERPDPVAKPRGRRPNVVKEASDGK